VLAALDIATSASYSEGFPNAIGEAMCCGVPCVVTDVGASASLVGEAGLVIPPRNAEALTAAWRELIDCGPDRRRELGLHGRERIATHFAMASVARHYEELYSEAIEMKLRNDCPKRQRGAALSGGTTPAGALREEQ
jgi:glycosyltransferase involved in cell wall biosynthesis